MSVPISAKEFRLRFSEICNRVEKGQSFMVFKRSKPAMRLEPVYPDKQDLLNRAGELPGDSLSLEEINAIVHKVRKEIR